MTQNSDTSATRLDKLRKIKPDLSVRGSEIDRANHNLEVLEQWKPSSTTETAMPDELCSCPENHGTHLRVPSCQPTPPTPEKVGRICNNPNHALVDGSPSPHEIGSSCMAERSGAEKTLAAALRASEAELREMTKNARMLEATIRILRTERTSEKLCKHGDPFCPCPDGDTCHYEGKNPMPTPEET